MAKIREVIGKRKQRSHVLEILDSLQNSADILVLDALYITTNGADYRRLDEGRKWINGRFKRNIGIDQPPGAGQPHAHVYGRKGDEIVTVNIDATSSHGRKGRLHPKDADPLRSQGFKIRDDNIVEWWVVGKASELLLG